MGIDGMCPAEEIAVEVYDKTAQAIMQKLCGYSRTLTAFWLTYMRLDELKQTIATKVAELHRKQHEIDRIYGKTCKRKSFVRY